MKRFLFVMTVVLFLQPEVVYAQPWIESLPENGRSNFYDIQRSFNQYWTGKDTRQKGKGWKQFKRWEWFWEQRVHPSGEFPNPMQLYMESRKTATTRGMSIGHTGGNWTEMGPSQAAGGYAGLGRLNCVRVDPTNTNILWVGSAGGGLWKSTNSGSTWSTTTDELPSIGVTDVVIDPTNTNIMYIATGDGDASDTYSVGVMKSTNGGATWNTTGLNWTTSQNRTINRLHMHPTNTNIILAAGNNGIHKTTNGGSSWIQTTSVSCKDMEFKPGDPAIMYASRSNGQIYRSTNTGDSWSQVTTGLPTSGAGRVALGVTPANSSYVYALYANSSGSGFLGLYRSTDSGVSWTLMSNSPNTLGWETDGSDTDGQGWYDLALAVSPTNAEHIFTGGVNNWKSTNGGATWSIISMWYSGAGPPAVHADQHDLWFVPGTNTLYAGNDGGIYRTTNSGSTWTWLGNGLKITQFYKLGVSQTNSTVVIAGAQDNGTKAVTSGVWDDVLGGDGMECIVDYTNANIMYGSLYYGDLYRSANGGSSFSYISGGVTESGAWVTPYVLHPTAPATIFAGYTNVWKSTNSGSTWTNISSFGSGTLDNITVAPSNPNIIYLSNGSSLYRTTDGGTSGWPSITSATGNFVTAIAVHPTDPNTAWVTASGYTAGGKVYKTTNGGTSWTNISGTLPNVPANTIVYENGSTDRIYVGTDIGVYYRDSGSSDWQDFNTGLPNVVVSELEIQYSAGKIRAATYGRGIWESPLPSAGVAVLVSTPDSISATLAPGDSTTQTLTITNNGTIPLTWNIQTGSPSKPQQVHTSIPSLKGQDDKHNGTSATETSGGPDTFGYRWIDSDEPGGPTYAWVDISGIGTAVSTGQWIPSGTFAAADDGFFPLVLPFPFDFYGANFDSLFISTNGNLRLTRPGAVDHTNATLPSNDGVNTLIAPFWDDLNLSTSGTVHYYHDVANARFIVQYTNVPPYSGIGAFTFEVILQQNGNILFQYSSMTGAVLSSTVGMENAAGSDGLQVVFNSMYVHNGLSVLFPNPAWLGYTPTSGTIPPSNAQNVSVTLRATGPAGSTQQADILLYSNDAFANPKVVPVSLFVSTITQTLSIPMVEEWNMVSVPLTVTNYQTTSVFPGASSQAFKYEAGYQSQDTLRNTLGYWLKYPSAQNIQITGEPVGQDTFNVAADWNLIGSITEPIPVAAVIAVGASRQSPFYHFSGTGYAVADTLHPGRGYWVKMSGTGQLILDTNSPWLKTLETRKK